MVRVGAVIGCWLLVVDCKDGTTSGMILSFMHVNLFLYIRQPLCNIALHQVHQVLQVLQGAALPVTNLCRGDVGCNDELTSGLAMQVRFNTCVDTTPFAGKIGIAHV